MTITRQAKYLSGVDRGKHVAFIHPEGKYSGAYRIEGTLVSVKHLGDGSTTLVVHTLGGIRYGDITENTTVTITGTPAPAGLNLHRSVIDQDG